MAEATVTPVTDAELKIAFSGPAVAANRFFAVISPGGVRIAFAEEDPQKSVGFRTAVVMGYEDAINMCAVLKEMLAPIEEQIKQAKKAAKNA